MRVRVCWSGERSDYDLVDNDGPVELAGGMRHDLWLVERVSEEDSLRVKVTIKHLI